MSRDIFEGLADVSLQYISGLGLVSQEEEIQEYKQLRFRDS